MFSLCQRKACRIKKKKVYLFYTRDVEEVDLSKENANYFLLSDQRTLLQKPSEALAASHGQGKIL